MYRLIILTFLIVGCGKEVPEAETPVVIPELDVVGSWETVCYKSGTSYVIDKMVISETSLIEITESYPNQGCENLRYLYEYTYQYEILMDPTADVHSIDFIITSYEFSARDTESADALNEAETCGLTTWAVSEAKDLLGGCVETAKGDTFFNIIKVDGDTMAFGETSTSYDGKEEDGRPQALSKVEFKRQD